MNQFKSVGEFVCPSDDGDFSINVLDLAGWSTGSCLIEQVGQGQKHHLILTKDEALNLAALLLKFATT